MKERKLTWMKRGLNKNNDNDKKREINQNNFF
jgi:hypothetical protein